MPRGSCMCGKLSYEYDKPDSKVVCHCKTCRKLTGSAFLAGILVPSENVKINMKPERAMSTTHETGMHMTFFGCDQCPSVMYKEADGMPGMRIVFAGTLDGDEDVASEGTPQSEIWIKYRVPWLKALDGCAQFEGFPPA